MTAGRVRPIPAASSSDSEVLEELDSIESSDKGSVWRLAVFPALTGPEAAPDLCLGNWPMCRARCRLPAWEEGREDKAEGLVDVAVLVVAAMTTLCSWYRCRVHFCPLAPPSQQTVHRRGSWFLSRDKILGKLMAIFF